MNQTLNGVVVAVLVARDPTDLRSQAEPQVNVTFEGIAGDRHAGLTMRAGGRHLVYPRGTEIRNTRQISIVSAEELAETAQAMGVPELQPDGTARTCCCAIFRSLPCCRQARGCISPRAWRWWSRAKITPAPR